jgi:hypothetical protein
MFTIALVFVLFLSITQINHNNEPPEGFFFGASYGLEEVSEAKLLIDKVKDYTNFFLLGSWAIITNETALNEVCGYATDAGLSFIVFFDFISPSEMGYTWHQDWILNAKNRWGDKFLGIYIYEEPGGKQIDTGLFDTFKMDPEKEKMYENVTTYSEAAQVYLTELPQTPSFEFLKNNNITRFVSDYALYWFDYLAGYDTVFAELGWGHNASQQIGLCRGSAKAQNKEWGTIITWKSSVEEPESIKTASEMLQDMYTSYEAGAKYVIVFNFPQYPEGNPYGVLTEEHFTAMQQFWNYACEHPEDYGKTSGQTAFVLPKDYGWGMRQPEDKIWGLWPADNQSQIIWEKMNTLIEKYDLQLDIVYDDPRFNYENYIEIYYYNTTIN